MTDCGHASGVTYAGCMKCDLDKQAEHITELEEQVVKQALTIAELTGLREPRIEKLEAKLKRVEGCTVYEYPRGVRVVHADDLDEAIK